MITVTLTVHQGIFVQGSIVINLNVLYKDRFMGTALTANYCYTDIYLETFALVTFVILSKVLYVSTVTDMILTKHALAM